MPPGPVPLPDATSTASGHRTDRGGVSRIRLAPPSWHFSISSDKSRGIFFPWKPESGLFVYLWPQLDWAQRGSLFGEGTGKKNSGDVSSAGGPPARPGQRGGPSTGRSTRLGLKSPQGLPFTPKPSCSQLESNFLIWSHPVYNGSLRSPIPDEYYADRPVISPTRHIPSLHIDATFCSFSNFPSSWSCAHHLFPIIISISTHTHCLPSLSAFPQMVSSTHLSPLSPL